MKFWQSLAFVEVEQLLELARLAEALGFHGVSYPDHLVTTKAQIDRYRYSDDGRVPWTLETPWLDPWGLATALAQATTRLRFMTTVYVLPLRDPFSAAKAISTAAVLSGNRVALGVGLGWQRTEFDLVGRDFRRRGARTDELLEVLGKLLSGTVVEHRGRFYEFPPLQMTPGVAEPVPIYIGGQSPAALRRAARHDGWIGLQYEAKEVAPLLAALRRARRDAGTEQRPFEIWVALRNPTRDALAHLEDLGVTMVNGASFLVDGKAEPSSLETKRRLIEEFAIRFLR
jgi:probable F420-dependent oxidoreductase